MPRKLSNPRGHLLAGEDDFLDWRKRMYIVQYYVIDSVTPFDSNNPDYKSEVLAGPFSDAAEAYFWQRDRNLENDTYVVHTRVPVKLGSF